MVTRTFIDKSNTIIRLINISRKGDGTIVQTTEKRHDNFGLNPIAMLDYGHINTRFLIQFDVHKLKCLVNEGTYAIDDNIKHTLKMTNCGSINVKEYNEYLPSPDSEGLKKRATSFEIIALKVPAPWDAGIGFDNSSDFFFTGGISISTDGSNWDYAKTGIKWENSGVYSDETIIEEYVKYSTLGESDIIVASQKFDFGNEDIEMDITKYVNSLINDEEVNNGLLLMYAPFLEVEQPEMTCYTGFFNNNTNTFFLPYVETIYNSPVKNDRHNFRTGKNNRLYLFLYNDGSPVDSDETPICKINGIEFPVTRQRRGVYYATVKLSSTQYQKENLVYDEWDNVSIDGEDIGEIEQYFEVQGPSISFEPKEEKTLTCTFTNLNDNARFLPDGKLDVNVIFRYAYTKKLSETITNPEYRIYVQDGDREVTVVDWDGIDRIDCERNIFTIDFSEFVPHKYYIDIRVKDNGKEKIFKETGIFTIENETTKRRR